MSYPFIKRIIRFLRFLYVESDFCCFNVHYGLSYFLLHSRNINRRELNGGVGLITLETFLLLFLIISLFSNNS